MAILTRMTLEAHHSGREVGSVGLFVPMKLLLASSGNELCRTRLGRAWPVGVHRWRRR